MKPGTKVRFTTARLGLVEFVGDTKYLANVEMGDEGTYIEPAERNPNLKRLAEQEADWHVIEVPVKLIVRGDPGPIPVRTLYCVCHASHFEPAQVYGEPRSPAFR